MRALKQATTLALATLTLTGCCARSQLIIEPMEGKGFVTSIEACLLARELTDEEIDNADQGKGCGFHNSKKAGEDAWYWCNPNPDGSWSA